MSKNVGAIMGDVVTATFSKTLGPIKGMPKSAPEVLNQLAVLAHDRNKVVKELEFAQKTYAEAGYRVNGWLEDLAKVDAKIRDAQQGLVDDIIREVIPGRIV